MRASHRGVRTGSLVAVIAAFVIAWPVASPGFALAKADAATAATGSPAGSVNACRHPNVPAWFHESLVTAIAISGDLQPGWADSPNIPRIICWQGSDFDVSFSPAGDDFHAFHGVFAMTVEEVEMIVGPWHIANKDGFKLSTKCFVWGWEKCPRQPQYSRITQQGIAGLRWIWLTYGTPKVAWQHIKGTGRFSAFPRPGTDDTATKTPLGLCPVDGAVSYWDDFGQPRYVGGYHPHAGNDIAAPIGRPIRAPIDGLAIPHTDTWFSGNSVAVIGAKGYVRNAHLSRFGTLGYVTAGTIIGYVGETGDAEAPHDHFEWHPWVVATPLHQAPSGFSRVMEAIDPFPFLNQVCG
jgi:hypothetical protein